MRFLETVRSGDENFAIGWVYVIDSESRKRSCIKRSESGSRTDAAPGNQGRFLWVETANVVD
jgi:hypothetical protein